jgi:hypothetical protein
MRVFPDRANPRRAATVISSARFLRRDFCGAISSARHRRARHDKSGPATADATRLLLIGK